MLSMFKNNNIHYSSHIQRYPSDKEIITYSKYAHVLEMHSWVWQNRHDEKARDAEGKKIGYNRFILEKRKIKSN